MSELQVNSESLISKTMSAFDRLQKREQKLLFVGVPITCLLVLFLMFVEPEFKKVQRSSDSVTTMENQLLLARQSKQELLNLAEQDPNTEINAQIDSLQRRLDQLNQEFEGELSQLVSPQAMPVLLEQLLYKAEKLSLLSVKSIKPERINLQQADVNEQSAASNLPAENSDSSPIYKHGIEISFEGSFFATRNFLDEAQNLGWKLYWEDLSYEVKEHPKAVTHLTLFTLSTSEAFIGVN